MFQKGFLATAATARTNTAILFFALAMMVLFNDKIDPLKKRILFIVFMASCMVSHYSTTYIFFFIMLGAFVGVEILSKKYTFKKIISLSLVILFFALIFFWYSQVTETAFNAGVNFVENTFLNLNKFFVEEMRSESYVHLVGQELVYPILSRVNFVLTWCTFIFIGIGVLTMIKRYKKMIVISDINLKKPDFLKTKFEMEYLVMTLACVGLLVIMVALPHVSIGYGIQRLYTLMTVILSVCFVIGGITLSHFLSKERTCAKKVYGNIFSQGFCEAKKLFGKTFLSKKKSVLKEKQKSLIKNFSFKKKPLLKKSFLSPMNNGENGLQVRAYLVILLILIPYFLFGTGVIHIIFVAPYGIILNSEGRQYDNMYIHDKESCSAEWLKNCMDQQNKIATDYFAPDIFMSQAFSKGLTDSKALFKDEEIEGYIYLRYVNVVDGKLQERPGQWHNLTDYSNIFIEKGKIYDNGGSEVYK